MKRKIINYIMLICLLLVFLCPLHEVYASDKVRVLYQEYRSRFESIKYKEDISENGFVIV